ncbi:hypothetical protein COK91_07020 [Bacillus cereus]|uniref:hypothetical protein n=1 Tax=Bacillus cereus TaxID=1396 RepID=UPI000BF977BB|nr:hypothetical protein [Bacillus cereus]PFU83466.1 hypothetical protein COK91_07020 [Bacillus cereus]
MKEKITTKDLSYWIIILIGVIVMILTIKLGDNATAVDYIGFAGTITSILLAVVALMYSFYQNNAYESSTQQLEESARKIKKAVKELEQVAEFKEVVNEMREESATISKSINNLQEVVSTIKTGVHEVNNNIENSIQGLQEVVSTIESEVYQVNTNLEDAKRDIFEKMGSQLSGNNPDDNSTNLQELISGLGNDAFNLLYLGHYMYEKETKIKRSQLTKFFVDNIMIFKEGKPENVQYDNYDRIIFGSFFMCIQLGFFKLELGSEIGFSKFNKSIGDAIKARVSDIMGSKDSESKKHIEAINEFVDQNVQ